MPDWVEDIANLLQIFEFLFVVLTTGLGWLLSRTLPREAPPPATAFAQS
jgi:hypothetical protein